MEMIKLLCTLAVLLPLASIDGFNIQPRIIEGILSKPNQFKFFVVVNKYACSGVLISDRWVLTAGHCLTNIQPFNVYILNDNYTPEDEMEIPAENQYIHPTYIGARYPSNDIALIKLPRNVVQSASIQPVKLSNKCGIDLDNIDVIAIGTGHTSLLQSSIIDKKLRHVYLKTISSDECNRRALARDVLPNSVICANRTDDGGSVAHGDSGGPLVERSDGNLIGLTSFMVYEIPHRAIITLQAFTRIHTYFDWIEKVTGLEMPVCDK